MPTSPGGPLIQALQALWARIQTAMPDLPPVRIAIASTLSPPGHGPERWTTEDDGTVTGLYITASTLREGADAVVSEVLHHAAHLLSWTRDTPDTHSRGHYHTKKFVDAAQDVGLVWPADKPRDKRTGYADVELTPDTHERYKRDTKALADIIPGVLPHLETPSTGQSSRQNRVTLRCRCVPKPRSFQMHASVAAQGPIVCTVCGSEFATD
ncbi:hypothetical protein ACFUGD_01370 [Streptomyces sp. NPDC057217]|uniref:hypothetical protein n=1 Tax=Streptomyces sp. NPDC057217 TaxID=3346054 RepID=UPI00363027C3